MVWGSGISCFRDVDYLLSEVSVRRFSKHGYYLLCRIFYRKKAVCGGKMLHLVS